ncbi:MAG: hypothetical protein Q8903_14010 [Bacteroidota bacterium]|nr:hypothetical protein [Bacteroidota bacterium]
MSKISLVFTSLLRTLFLIHICAAVDFSVSPVTKIAHPGETVSYDLSVSLNSNDDPNLTLSD